MAKVRVQLFCHGCQGFLDATLHASKVDRIVAGFKTAHDGECFEEDPKVGEEEAVTDPGKDGAPGQGVEDDATAANGANGASGASKDQLH